MDLLPPVLITVAAVHELLYDHSGWATWLLVLATIWPLVWRRRAPLTVLAVCLCSHWRCGPGPTTPQLISRAGSAIQRGRPSRCPLRRGCGRGCGGRRDSVLDPVRPHRSANDALVLLTGVAAAALFLGTTMRGPAAVSHLGGGPCPAAGVRTVPAGALAAAAERTRIAREMHDIIAHGLSVVITLAEGAAVATTDNDDAREAMQLAAAAGRQS